MAEKDGRENLGDDLGQRQRQFLLELSSALQDEVPSPGIAFVRMTPSKNTISVNDLTYSFLLFTVSAPPETDPKSAGRPRLAIYTTYPRKLPKPHVSQSFLPQTVEDRSRQEDSQ